MSTELNWTKDLPTVAGYYFTAHRRGWSEKETEPSIDMITVHGIGETLYVAVAGNDCGYTVEEYAEGGCMFYGPLPVPESPDLPPHEKPAKPVRSPFENVQLVEWAGVKFKAKGVKIKFS